MTSGSLGESGEAVLRGLKKAGITFITHIPDKLLTPILTAVQGDPFFREVMVSREEEGFGVAAGAYMGGLRCAMFMQSTGLGNSLGALTSVNIPHQIPVLIFMSFRGGLNEYNPSDVPLGLALRSILQSIGIACYEPQTPEEVEKIVVGSQKQAKTSRLPVAILLTPELLKG